VRVSAAQRADSDVAKRTMRSVSLAAPRMLPIRMKSGAANESGNEFIACAIFWETIGARKSA